MRELLTGMDIAVSAAGSTIYEIVVCGVPLVTYVLADNQIHGVEAFDRLGLAIDVGDIRENSLIGVQMILKVIEDSYKTLCEIGNKQQKLIGRHGAERIANMLCEKFYMN